MLEGPINQSIDVDIEYSTHSHHNVHVDMTIISIIISIPTWMKP